MRPLIHVSGTTMTERSSTTATRHPAFEPLQRFRENQLAFMGLIVVLPGGWGSDAAGVAGKIFEALDKMRGGTP